MKSKIDILQRERDRRMLEKEVAVYGLRYINAYFILEIIISRVYINVSSWMFTVW